MRIVSSDVVVVGKSRDYLVRAGTRMKNEKRLPTIYLDLHKLLETDNCAYVFVYHNS
jgi:hypothetical protein